MVTSTILVPVGMIEGVIQRVDEGFVVTAFAFCINRCLVSGTDESWA
jgi:hypothetical protein